MMIRLQMKKNIRIMDSRIEDVDEEKEEEAEDKSSSKTIRAEK